MSRAAARDKIYHHRRYSPQVIELWLRGYRTYRLSFPDLTPMKAA